MVIPASADILLVDNDPYQAELTKAAILQSKLTDKIHLVKDGEEALHFIFGQGNYLGRNVNQLPRIIILDFNILKVGAIELLKIIKENNITKKIAVIILSCLKESEHFLEIINAGGNICLTDTDFEEFSKSLKQELGYYWRLFEN